MGLSTEEPFVARVYAAAELTKTVLDKLGAAIVNGENPITAEKYAAGVAKIYATIYAEVSS